MLRLLKALCLSTYYFIEIIKQTAGQHTLVRNEQFQHKDLRVIDGQDIKNGEYSFVVVLFQVKKHSYRDFGIHRGCTASMITKNWVITAAHCVDYLHGKTFYVWYGNYSMSPFKSKLFTLVLEVVIHPAYRTFAADYLDSLIVDNDISLIRADDIHLQSYGRLSSIDHTTMIGLSVKYVGGGITNKPGDDEIRLLQVGEAAIIPCNMEFRDLTRYLICITPKCSNRLHRTDSGDSGGPLLYDDKIIGVLSFGQNTDRLVMDGYAPVSPYIDWIYEVIRSK